MSIVLGYDDLNLIDERIEILNGKEVKLASPLPGHSSVGSNVNYIFQAHLRQKNCLKCRVFYEMDVRLTEKDLVKPDIIVVCNPDFVDASNIIGPPDLIVEILSTSTAKRDRGYKKTLYESVGVKEYWIIDAIMRHVEVYIFHDGKYTLDHIYMLPTKNVMPTLRPEEIDALTYTFKTSIFEDLIIDIRDVFRGIEG